MSQSPFAVRCPPIDDDLVSRVLSLPMRALTAAEVRAAGLAPGEVRELVRVGALRRPLRGVYVPFVVTDDLASRVAALRLVVPSDCVVTDRSAGWLWGADVLAPGDHLETPLVSVFAPPGRRLRNGLCLSGERSLGPGGVHEMLGLQVTTPLRTACDLGRLLRRRQALGAMDQLARVGSLTAERLGVEMARFKGYRGVIQGRELAGVVDPGSESQPESEVRLVWLDSGLPAPRCQVPVPAPEGGWYYLDVANAEHRIAAEYDGEQFHGPEQAEHDRRRRRWCREAHGWTIEVLRSANLYGHHQDVECRLRALWRAKKR